jgi:hypothetical protein
MVGLFVQEFSDTVNHFLLFQLVEPRFGIFSRRLGDNLAGRAPPAFKLQRIFNYITTWRTKSAYHGKQLTKVYSIHLCTEVDFPEKEVCSGATS